MKMLNKIAVVLILFAISIPAFANTELCSNMSRYAEVVVESRYRGVEMRRHFEEIIPQQDNEVAKGLMSAIVRDAYNLPYMNAESNQQQQKQEFGDNIFAFCIGQFAEDV